MTCYLPTVGSPSETRMIKETDSGSSIPKLLASFRIKMARSSASLIFVPVRVTLCAVLLCTLALCKTITSWVQVHLSHNHSCVIYSAPRSFNYFPSDTNFPQAGQDSPVESSIHFVQTTPLKMNSTFQSTHLSLC